MPRVLLADDSPTNRLIVELSFAQETVELVTVENGRQALDYLQENPVDALLVSASISEVDGYAICRHVRSEPATSELPIVLMTGRFEPYRKDQVEGAEPDLCLTRPFETTELVTSVLQLLEKRVQHPQPEISESMSVENDRADDKMYGAVETQAVPVRAERKPSMLMDFPLREGSAGVIFTLNADRCNFQSVALERDVPPEPFSEMPDEQPFAEEETDQGLAAQHEEAVQEMSVSESEESADQESFTAAARESQPLVEPAHVEPKPENVSDSQVEKVMDKLSDRLPGLIREIMREESD